MRFIIYILLLKVTKSVLNTLQADCMMQFIIEYILQISLTNKQI